MEYVISVDDIADPALFPRDSFVVRVAPFGIKTLEDFLHELIERDTLLSSCVFFAV